MTETIKKQKYEHYLKKYNEYCSNLIIQLDEFAEELDLAIDNDINGKPITMDFRELINVIDNIYKDTNEIEPKILEYVDYLRGVALPLYDKTFTIDDFVDNDRELSLIETSPSWCDLRDNMKAFNIDDRKLVERLEPLMSDKLIVEYNKCMNKLSFMYGYYHYWKINIHNKVMSFINKKIKWT